jgi:hypothetical protein
VRLHPAHFLYPGSRKGQQVWQVDKQPIREGSGGPGLGELLADRDLCAGVWLSLWCSDWGHLPIPQATSQGLRPHLLPSASLPQSSLHPGYGPHPCALSPHPCPPLHEVPGVGGMNNFKGGKKKMTSPNRQGRPGKPECLRSMCSGPSHTHPQPQQDSLEDRSAQWPEGADQQLHFP